MGQGSSVVSLLLYFRTLAAASTVVSLWRARAEFAGGFGTATSNSRNPPSVCRAMSDTTAADPGVSRRISVETACPPNKRRKRSATQSPTKLCRLMRGLESPAQFRPLYRGSSRSPSPASLQHAHCTPSAAVVGEEEGSTPALMKPLGGRRK